MPEGLSITFNDKKRVEEKRVKDIIILGRLVSTIRMKPLLLEEKLIFLRRLL